MSMRRASSLSMVVAAATLIATAATTAPAVAQAETSIRVPHSGRRPLQLDVHAGITYVGLGLAAGARFGIPIVQNGFVPSINF